MTKKRAYRSELREAQAQATRNRILEIAEELFRTLGFEQVTIEGLAECAGVSAPTIYSLFRSKLGVLRAVMYEAQLPKEYGELMREADVEESPAKRLALSARIARHLREREREQQELFRGAALLHPEFRELEREREEVRYEVQRRSVERFIEEGALREGLTFEKGRDILWMLTGRDVYRMLVVERGWSADEYEEWLAEELCRALLDSTQ